MLRRLKVVLTFFALSLAASLAAFYFHSNKAAFWLGAPALLLSGWAFIGHFVTIDEDLPGGWSNQENSKDTSRESLRVLLIKAVAFAVAVWLVLLLPAGQHGA